MNPIENEEMLDFTNLICLKLDGSRKSFEEAYHNLIGRAQVDLGLYLD